MIKMNNENNEETNDIIITKDKVKTISPFLKLNDKIQNDSLFIQKGREYMKNKKAISMKHVFDSKEKIRININQNININANMKNKDEVKSKEIDAQSEEGKDVKLKGMKMKSCIFTIESDRKKDKKTILSMNLKRSKSREMREVDSSYKMKKLHICLFFVPQSLFIFEGQK